ncbi:RDD family protein [Streptomyces sp. NPDC005805]|uniref:RDD family protein n=1 Tax=Streptomyces sp. NPDC005805 TaxID=3157068 RepID=UPI00340A2F93
MSAPTPATGDTSPAPGYYPDPSIPGYVRYWNGASWVPGTSRPVPASGEDMPTPPASTAAAPGASRAPAPRPPAPVEETGPVFLDEEPGLEPARPEPASAWGADAARQSGFGGDLDNRVSWGSPPGPAGNAPDPRRPADPPAQAGAGSASADPAGPVPVDPSGGRLPGMRSVGPDAQAEPRPRPAADADPAPGAEPPTDGTVTIRAVRPGAEPRAEHTVTIRPQRPSPAAPTAPASRTQTPPAAPAHPEPAPQQAAPAAPAPATPATPQAPAAQTPAPVTDGPGGGAASWAQQVHQLAQSGPASAGADQPVLPWKPPVDDPFLRAAQAQANARPASLGKRLTARLIDTVLLGALVGAVAVPVGTSAWEHIDGKIQAARLSGETVTVWLVDGTTAVHLGIVLGALLLLGVLYEALPTAKWGRTAGKKLCGVRVLDIETHEPPSFGGALRRWLLYGVLGLLVVGIANVLWCVFDRPWRQCWHDKAVHTFVSG